jgi:hypothetical protein
MFVDHTGLFVVNNLWLRVVGRLSFPIFAIIYGYHFKKINYSLLLPGIILCFFHYFLYREIFFNILISFFLGGVLLELYNKITYKILFFELLLIGHFAIYEYLEYGFYTFLFMLITQKNKKYFFLIFILYFIEQSFRFNFNTIQQLSLMVALSFLSFSLYNYENKRLKNNIFIKFVARYSMEIFFIQNLLFNLFAFTF